MPNEPHLVPNQTLARPGIVLVLHGGASRRTTPRSAHAAVPPPDGPIARAGRGRLAVFRLLNSIRGRDTRRTPLDDVAWALAELGERRGDELPVCLVGHSLGGRAAILSAGRAGGPQRGGPCAAAP